MSLNAFTLAQAILSKERELYELRSQLTRLQKCSQLPSAEFAALRCRLQSVSVAVPALQTREVVQMPALTELPSAAPWLAGLLSLGNERIPVVDLWAHESGGARARHPGEFIVLTQTAAGSCGLIVDAIEGLVVIDGSKLFRPAPELPLGPHVMGVVTLAGESVLLLSAAALSVGELALEGAE